MITRIMAIFSVSVFYAISAPWPGVSYSEVRAYSYNTNGLMESSILIKGKLADSVMNKEGTILSTK